MRVCDWGRRIPVEEKVEKPTAYAVEMRNIVKKFGDFIYNSKTLM